jgi:hypothetical protein
MTEARIERVAEALELIVQARLKRAPTQAELRDEAKKLLKRILQVGRTALQARTIQSSLVPRDFTPAWPSNLISCSQPGPDCKARSRAFDGTGRKVTRSS